MYDACMPQVLQNSLSSSRAQDGLTEFVSLAKSQECDPVLRLISEDDLPSKRGLFCAQLTIT